MGERMTEQQIMLQERNNSGTTWTRNEDFERDGYFVVKNLWDPEELYHPVPDIRGQLNYWDNDPDHFQHNAVENQVEGCVSRYYHPQYKMIHSGVRGKLEKILGRKLYNTYYYDRYYFEGQELQKHADRGACEISVTVHISSNLPEPERNWPVKIKTPDTYTDDKKTHILVPGEVREVVLEPGDGMIYKGCERPHWRDPLQGPKSKGFFRKKKDTTEYYFHQIFFHYVLQDGQRAHCAWDKSR